MKLVDPNKPLLAQPFLYMVVVLLLLISGTIAFLIATHTPAKPDFSAAGFNQFVTMFQVPLGIAALIIPVTAIITSHYRSLQIIEQSIFTNYFKHAEEFALYAGGEKFRELLGGGTNIKDIHNAVFSDARHGVYAPNPEILMRFDGLCSQVLSTYETFSRGNNDPATSLIELEKRVSAFISDIGIYVSDKVTDVHIRTKPGYESIQGDLRQQFLRQRKILETVQELFQFFSHVKAPQALRNLAAIDAASIPGRDVDGRKTLAKFAISKI